MKIRFLRRSVGIAIALVFACQAHSRVILVAIGCVYGEEGGQPQLNESNNDVDIMTSVLQHDATRSIILKSDGGGKMTKTKIEEAVHRGVEECLPDDTFVVYFAGHGESVGTAGYLVPEGPADGNEDPEKDYISVSELRRYIGSDCKASSKYMVLDACAAGSKEADFDASGVTTIAAAEPGHKAYEADGHSLFTREFADALTDGSALDSNGAVDFGKLHEVVAGRIEKDCRRSNLPLQRPVFLIAREPPPPTSTLVSRSEDLPEPVRKIFSREPVDITLLQGLKEGVGILIETKGDKTEAASKAESLLRESIIDSLGFEVFGEQRSHDLSSIIDAVSTIKTDERELLKNRWLIKGKISYEVRQVNDPMVGSFFSATVDAQASLITIYGRIEAEATLERPVSGSGASELAALNNALSRAMKQIIQPIKAKLALHSPSGAGDEKK